MAADKIYLVNLRNAPFLATEYHDIVCRRRNRCDCGTKELLGPDNKPRVKKLPASFHIEALSRSRPLDRAVLHIPQVQQAMRSDPPWLKVEELAPAASAAKAEPVKGKTAKAKKEEPAG